MIAQWFVQSDSMLYTVCFDRPSGFSHSNEIKKNSSEAQLMCSISPVSVVSCLILAKWRKGVSRNIFDSDCVWLCDQIIADGGDVVGYQAKKTFGCVISEYASQMLQSCVNFGNGHVSPIVSHSSFVQLAYNKNSIACKFSVKSVVGLFESFSLKQSTYQQWLSLLEWWTIVSFLTKLLRTLFRCATGYSSNSFSAELDLYVVETYYKFQPCENLREIIKKTVSDWTTPVQGLLSINSEKNKRSISDSGDYHISQRLFVRCHHFFLDF